jgi:hypothetical protein
VTAVPRRPRQLLALTAAAIGLTVALGCREELGPERFPTASVSGVILQGGGPVSGGWVEFQPFDGAVGNFRSAKIQPDGTFRRDGVAVGPNLIRLVDIPGLSMNVAAVLYNRAQIVRTIPREPGEPIRIDLVEELNRMQEAENARTRPASQ